MTQKTLFALDFDGVICDSAIETAITGWKAAQAIWADMKNQPITDEHIKQFRRIRPCLEVGFEAILIMRLLQQRVLMNASCEQYQQQLKSLISGNLNTKNLQQCFAQTRDHAIHKDEAAWIKSNPIFPGIAKKLEALNQDDWIIVTTKQERFVKRLLQGNNIQLDESRIYGLDRKLNKQTVLKLLLNKHKARPITFIEDRLPTLIDTQKNPNLKNIKLQLVDWGYNTAVERNTAQRSGIEVITKAEFLRDSFQKQKLS